MDFFESSWFDSIHCVEEGEEEPKRFHSHIDGISRSEIYG
jgi:hypothetical protein